MAEQGPIEMRKQLKAGWVATLLLAGSTMVVAGARAQEMSQKSVETLMEYAWAITPDRFTKPNGQTVEIDRNNRPQVEVPLDTAREVIRVGRLSAHAQVCDLKEEHTANFRTMMAREAIKKKWSEQQFVFMNQLHMVTVMLLTGQLKLIEREEGKEAQVAEETVGKKATCTPEQRLKVKEAVTAYLKSGPQLVPDPPPTAAGGPAPMPAVPSAAPASAPAFGPPPAKK
jgi:hypothetical protein